MASGLQSYLKSIMTRSRTASISSSWLPLSACMVSTYKLAPSMIQLAGLIKVRLMHRHEHHPGHQAQRYAGRLHG